MSVSLSSLVSRLQAAVPARNKIPSVLQYDYAVRDAVSDYGRRVPVRKETTVNFVSGVAAYTLPDDFLSLVAVLSLSGAGVLLGDTGIVPVAANFRERYSVAGLTLTVYPTPAYSGSRTVQYQAKHVLVGSIFESGGNYLDLTDDDAAIIMLKAQALALDTLANVAAQESWQYAIGDESVNKTGLAAALRAQAQEFEQRYSQTVKQTGSGRVYATRSRYDGTVSI